MKRLILLILSFVSLRIAVSQSIIVNPDGTHSTIFHNGNTSTIVNPNGTHSPVFHNGNISTVVNPNGTHSTIFHNGNTSTMVNPNGTTSTIFHNGNISTVVNSNGTQSTIFHNGNNPLKKTKGAIKNETPIPRNPNSPPVPLLTSRDRIPPLSPRQVHFHPSATNRNTSTAFSHKSQQRYNPR